MRTLYAQLLSWLMYRYFLFLSKRCSFKDFQMVWNAAYQAMVEAEWAKMKKVMNQPETSSMSTKSGLGGLGAGVEVQPREQRYKPISPRLDLVDGQGEKRQQGRQVW